MLLRGRFEDERLEDADGPVLRQLRKLRELTAEEVDAHDTRRANYLVLYPVRMAGKGKAEAHRRLQAGRDHAIPTFSMD